MRRLTLLFLLLALAPLRADTVHFVTIPGGTTVLQDGHVVAVGAPGDRAQFDIVVPSSHPLTVRRPPFDDATVTGNTVALSRTIPVPADTDVYIESDDPGARRIVGNRSGVPLPVVDGKVQVPDAWFPRPLFLLRSGYNPVVLVLPAHGLGDIPPIVMTRRWTPIVAGTGFILLVALALRPRRRVLAPSPVILPAETVDPDTIGPYRVKRLLGRGGAGSVYLATRDEQSYAVKVLRTPQPQEAWQRFEREVEVARRLNHRNLCRLVDADLQARPAPYLVLEHVAGETLATPTVPMPPDAVCRIVVQLLEGLVAAHAAGVVHRDIKPSNIMLAADGTVKLMDFGIASLSGAMTLTATGDSIGTPGFVAPEQVLDVHRMDARGDLFNVGLVAYWLLSGRRAFEAANRELSLLQLLQGELDPLEDVPEALATWVHRLLERRPEHRPPDAATALRTLRPVCVTAGPF